MKCRTIDLPHGYETIIDADDWPTVQGLTLYRDTGGYARFGIRNPENRRSTQSLHRFLLQAPRSYLVVVDHINGERLDNRRINLRLVSQTRNLINAHQLRSDNASGVRGVSYDRTRHLWMAGLSLKGQVLLQQRFTTKAAAIEARHAAELKYFGELCPTRTRPW